MQENLIEKANSFIQKSEIKDSKIFIDSKKQTISITGEFEGSIITSDIELMPNGYIGTNAQFFKKERKSDYLNDIVELTNKGYKQVEIARMLGISQSLVSQLLKQAKNII